MTELSAAGWAALACAALIVGISKTSLPGANTVAVAVFATVLPARDSTGALLILLLVGDAIALITYRRHADWVTLRRMAPAVAAGLGVGAVFLFFSGDEVLRRVIGAILLVLVGVTLWRRRVAPATAEHAHPRRTVAVVYGSLGGFMTMVANVGGPVMSMYFVAARFPVKAFIGTVAWFFALVNLAKVPVLAGMGLIDGMTLLLDVWLIPVVLMGAVIGRILADRISQRWFDGLVLTMTVVGALNLLFR